MRSLQAACMSSVQQQRTSAFPGGRGVTPCSDARWGFGITHEAWWGIRNWGGGVD